MDMENTFDRLINYFLLEAIHIFGFDESFVCWVQACIDSPLIAPLVNGRLTNLFKIKRGLQQGCPFSPLLYITMAKALSKKLDFERVYGHI